MISVVCLDLHYFTQMDASRQVFGYMNDYVTTGLCTIYREIGNEVVCHKFGRLCFFVSFFLLHEDNLFEHFMYVMKT